MKVRMLMKTKRTVSLLLAVLLSAGVFFSPSYAAGVGGAASVPEFIRTVDGYIESALRVLLTRLTVRYGDYKELCKIPELDGGYIPQGYCLSADGGRYCISYYSAKGEASIVSFVSVQTGERQKTVRLLNADGSGFKGHAGGIALCGDTLLIANGSKLSCIDLADIAACEDYGSVNLGDSFELPVNASYLSSDGEYVYVGEFYTYTKDDSYKTDDSHHISLSPFERSYSLMCAYTLESIEAFITSGKQSAPAMAFTTPTSVQGVCRLENGAFALSISYGRKYNSYLYTYRDVTEHKPAGQISLVGEQVPLYYLARSSRSSKLTLPPLLEGIAARGNEVTGVFESGAEKYSDASVIVDSICKLG